MYGIGNVFVNLVCGSWLCYFCVQKLCVYKYIIGNLKKGMSIYDIQWLLKCIC